MKVIVRVLADHVHVPVRYNSGDPYYLEIPCRILRSDYVRRLDMTASPVFFEGEVVVLDGKHVTQDMTIIAEEADI